jgi:hypothetical protein
MRLWIGVSSLLDRVRAALSGNRDDGALTLEWIVIAGILVAAAIAAGVVFRNAINSELQNLP